MRTCPKCGLEKKDEEFYSITTNQCKPCHRKYVIENQNKKSGYYRDYRKRYASQNKDKITEWREAWLKGWEAKNGIKFKEYLQNKRKEKLNDPTYLKEQSAKKKIRDARDKRIRETRKKEKIRIAKRMIQYWQNKLSKLVS